MRSQELQLFLQQQLPSAEIVVASDDDHHFTLTVVTDEFVNQSRIQRQQRVYAVMGELIRTGAVHAVELRTYSCQEWAQKHH